MISIYNKLGLLLRHLIYHSERLVAKVIVKTMISFLSIRPLFISNIFNINLSYQSSSLLMNVYAFVKRTMVYPFFELFDYANTEGSLGTRPQTTVAPQALLMLNSELITESASLIAESALSSKDPVGEAFRIILGRDPATAERSMAKSFLIDQHKKQEPLKGQIRFRPDYSSAFFNDYHKILPSKQFLKGPASGWDYFKGKWTGGYEGILRAERDWPAFALFRMDSRDFKISGKIHLENITERVSILLRARPRSDEFDG